MGVLSATNPTYTNADMCLITLAWNSHPGYSLLVAANRDEYYHRPTASARFWDETPKLLAGRDLQAGGTWMGVTRDGKFAAITNPRNPPHTPPVPRSRGMLPLEYLVGDTPAIDYLEQLAPRASDYAGFNLLLADRSGLHYFSNVEGRIRRLPAGVYGLSNGLLDDRWPKQELARERLAALAGRPPRHTAMRATVNSRSPAPDRRLPDTGVGAELERLLSSQFICTPEYGTRATTTLWISESGEVDLCEKSYLAGGKAGGSERWRFNLDERG